MALQSNNFVILPPQFNNITGTLSTVLAIITIHRNTDYGVGHYHPSQGTCHHKEEETVDLEISQKLLDSITT